MRLLRCKSWETHLGWDCWGSGEVKGKGQESHLPLGWVMFVLSEHTKVTPAPPQTSRLPCGFPAGMEANCAQLTEVQCKGWWMALAPGWGCHHRGKMGFKFAHHQCQPSMYKPSPLHNFHVFLITFQHGELAKTINIRWEFHPPTPTLSPAPLLPRICCYPQIFADSLASAAFILLVVPQNICFDYL